MIGLSRKEFRSHLEHYMRLNGRMSSEDFAKKTGELSSVIDLVRKGDIDPTTPILNAMGWVQFDHSYYSPVLVTEKRFMTISDALGKDYKDI